MKRIVICGNYGAKNLGDEAILEGILKLVRNKHKEAEIVVLSACPSQTHKIHGVKSAYLLPTGVRSLIKAILGLQLIKTLYNIAHCDAFILGGGGLFTDEKPFAIFLWGIHAKCAYLFRKPVHMYGQSIGPLSSKWAQKTVRKLFSKATSITLRDKESEHLLHAIGVQKKAQISADPAFLLNVPVNDCIKAQKYAILSIRPWICTPKILYKNLAQYIDWLYSEHGIKAVLMPFQVGKDDDRKELNKIFEHVEKRGAAEVLSWEGDMGHILQKFRNAEFVIGMRLHSLIFSCVANTPFVGIIYSPKVRNFLHFAKMENYGIELMNVSLDELKKMTIKITDQKTALKSHFQDLVGNAKKDLTESPLLL